MNKVLPSYCSLQAVLLSLYTEALDPLAMGSVMMDIAREAVERFEQARGTVDSGRIVDLNYDELVAYPIAAVRRIYEDLGYPFTPEFEERLQVFLARNRRAPRPRHHYTLGQFGLDENDVSEGFAAYHKRYGLTP
jgi:hypothetical protein